MVMVPTEQTSDPSAWTAEELDLDRSWEHTLSSSERAEILGATDGVAGRPLEVITAAAFPLPSLGKLFDELGRQLRSGRGFAIVHGLPIEELRLDDIERMYWGFCAHLGTGLTQNSDAGLTH